MLNMSLKVYVYVSVQPRLKHLVLLKLVTKPFTIIENHIKSIIPISQHMYDFLMQIYKTKVKIKPLSMKLQSIHKGSQI